MANKQADIVNMDLHPEAEKLARQRVNEYAATILLQAKTAAHNEKEDVVSRRHIDEAMSAIIRKKDNGFWKNLRLVFGGALIGAFIQGFPGEIGGSRPWLAAIYVAMGFIGLLLVVIP